MRVPRIKESGEGFYHSMPRVVDRHMVFDDKEKCDSFCRIRPPQSVFVTEDQPNAQSKPSYIITDLFFFFL